MKSSPPPSCKSKDKDYSCFAGREIKYGGMCPEWEKSCSDTPCRCWNKCSSFLQIKPQNYMLETDNEEIVISDSTGRARFQGNFHHHTRTSLADTGNEYSSSGVIQLYFPKTVLFPSATLCLIRYTPSKFCNKWGTDNSFIPTASSILCTDSSILCPVEKIGRNHVIKGCIIMPSMPGGQARVAQATWLLAFPKAWIVNVYIPLTLPT